jgi:hypothetical protein
MEVEEVFKEEIRRKFAGKWIAVKDERVVAVSDSHDEMIREIKRKGLDGIYVFYSPTEKEKKYEFLF